MQNFANTEWEQLTEEEIFNKTQGLVFTTIKKQFPNRVSFCKAHMLEYEDIVQMGNMGLLNAIKNFKNDGKTQFRTHAINCILWEISNQAKVQSLRNVNNGTFELAEYVNSEGDIDDIEAPTIGETLAIPKEEEPDYIVEGRVLEEQVIEFIKQDKDIDNLTLQIFVGKTKGLSVSEIAEQVGIHRNTVHERLRTRKVSRMKGRLEKYLKTGEV